MNEDIVQMDNDVDSHPKNEFFTGRTDLITRIDNSESKRIVILNGLPGAGKTSIAIEYLHRRIDDHTFKRAYWFDAENKEKIKAGFFRYGIESNNSEIAREEIIKNFIESLKDSKDVLLVFDNVEELNDVVDSINIHLIKCKTLITTRNPAVASVKAIKLEVPPFDLDEARQFLQKQLSNFKEENFDGVIGKLKASTVEDKTLPYYLVMFASSFNNTDMPANIEFNNEYMKRVLENLGERSSEIIFLLKHVMLIDPDHIPGKLIERILLNRGDFKKAVNVLKGQNLCKMIRPNTKHYGISVHRLLQKDLRDNLGLTSEQVTEKELYLLRLLEDEFPETKYQPGDNWNVADLYYRHIKILGHVIPYLERDIAARLYYKLSLYKRYVLRDYKGALDDGNELENITKEEKDQQYLAKIHANIGGIYTLLSKETEAIENYRQALKRYERLFAGGDHIEIATIYNNIGQSYTILGKHQEAMEYKKLALNMKQRIFLNDDSIGNLELAISFDAIAGTFSDTGYEKEAFDYYKLALDIREKTIKKDDPYLANSYNSIGLSYLKLQDKKNASVYLLKSLEMRQRLYKGDHQEIAATFNNLGLVHSLLHDEKNALEYKMKTFEMRRRLYAGDHYRLTISYHIIGRSFKNLEDHPKAIQYYTLALEMKRRIFSNADHIEIIAVLDDQGSSYSSMGAENIALACYTEFTEMKNRIQQSQSYAKIDIITDNSYLCFALSYCNLGETKKAHEYLEKCISVKFKDDHLLCMRDFKIGYLYFKLNNAEKALEYYTKAVELKLRNTIKDYFVADCYTHIALTYSSLGDKENALKYQQLSSEIHEELFGKDDHPKIATNFYNIGIIHSNLGDHEESLRNHKLAKDMRTRLFNDRHFTVFKSFKKIGSEYSYLGDQNKALKFLHRALELRTDLFEDDSLCVAKVYKCLGEVYFKNGNMIEALESYKSSLSMFNKFTLSPDNETLKECLDAVSEINRILGLE